jgi:hypothetical protein
MEVRYTAMGEARTGACRPALRMRAHGCPEGDWNQSILCSLPRMKGAWAVAFVPHLEEQTRHLKTNTFHQAMQDQNSGCCERIDQAHVGSVTPGIFHGQIDPHPRFQLKIVSRMPMGHADKTVFGNRRPAEIGRGIS